MFLARRRKRSSIVPAAVSSTSLIIFSSRAPTRRRSRRGRRRGPRGPRNYQRSGAAFRVPSGADLDNVKTPSFYFQTQSSYIPHPGSHKRICLPFVTFSPVYFVTRVSERGRVRATRLSRESDDLGPNLCKATQVYSLTIAGYAISSRRSEVVITYAVSSPRAR